MGNKSDQVLNNSFFGFLSRFFSLIFFALVSVFIASYYKTEAMVKNTNIEIVTSVNQTDFNRDIKN